MWPYVCARLQGNSSQGSSVSHTTRYPFSHPKRPRVAPPQRALCPTRHQLGGHVDLEARTAPERCHGQHRSGAFQPLNREASPAAGAQPQPVEPCLVAARCVRGRAQPTRHMHTMPAAACAARVCPQHAEYHAPRTPLMLCCCCRCCCCCAQGGKGLGKGEQLARWCRPWAAAHACGGGRFHGASLAARLLIAGPSSVHAAFSCAAAAAAAVACVRGATAAASCSGWVPGRCTLHTHAPPQQALAWRLRVSCFNISLLDCSAALTPLRVALAPTTNKHKRRRRQAPPQGAA
jgi:hypothetical protein